MKTLLLTLLILSGCGVEESSSNSAADSSIFKEVDFCQGFMNRQDEITTLVVYRLKSGDYYLSCMESDIDLGILSFAWFYGANSIGVQQGSLSCLDLDYSMARNMAFYRGEGITCQRR